MQKDEDRVRYVQGAISIGIRGRHATRRSLASEKKAESENPIRKIHAAAGIGVAANIRIWLGGRRIIFFSGMGDPGFVSRLRIILRPEAPGVEQLLAVGTPISIGVKRGQFSYPEFRTVTPVECILDIPAERIPSPAAAGIHVAV